MLVVARLVGRGNDDEPFSAPLPTFVMLDVDYTNKLTLIRIPDDDMPPELREAVKNPPAKRLVEIPNPRVLDHADMRLREHITKIYGNDLLARWLVPR